MDRVSSPIDEELQDRARRLVEDLNLTTLGWQIPSHRVIEDFAGHEHGLRAQEADPEADERSFALYDPEAGGDAQPIAVMVERERVWTLLPPTSD